MRCEISNWKLLGSFSVEIVAVASRLLAMLYNFFGSCFVLSSQLSFLVLWDSFAVLDHSVGRLATIRVLLRVYSVCFVIRLALCGDGRCTTKGPSGTLFQSANHSVARSRNSGSCVINVKMETAQLLQAVGSIIIPDFLMSPPSWNIFAPWLVWSGCRKELHL